MTEINNSRFGSSISLWGVMSGWEVDGVADNVLSTWSSFDEVTWIDRGNQGDHIVPETEILMESASCTPTESFQKTSGDSSLHANKSSNQMYQKLHGPEYSDPVIKEESFADLNTQESGHPSEEGTPISPNKGAWCELTPGNTSDVSHLYSSNRSGCFNGGGPVVRPKYETSEYGCEGAIEMCKDESGYQDDAADIVNSSCHFLLSDIYSPEGDLEFLAGVREEGRRDNLLDYGWGNTNNLEDMDKLFLSNDSMLSQGFDDNSDGMLWEPPSPMIGGSPGSMYQSVKVPMSPDFILKGDLKGYETKMDFLPCKMAIYRKQEIEPGTRERIVFSHGKLQTSSNSETSCSPIHPDNYIECGKENPLELQEASEGPSRGSESIEDEVPHALKEVEKASKVRRLAPSPLEGDIMYAFKESEKASKARRHGPRSKRLEENSRKQTSGRKLALSLSQAKKSPLVYMPVVSTAQDSPPCSTPISQITRVTTCEPISPMQCLQPVPYIHAGFGFSAHHHMPVVVPGPSIMPQQLQPQAQPVFVGYQPPLIDGPKLQQCKNTFEAPPQFPTVSSTMTPQEKIEKLRWRQKMQARLAVEQQQQQLINRHLIPEQPQIQRQENLQTHPPLKSSKEVVGGSVRLAPAQGAEPLVWNEVSVSPEGATTGDGDESLATSVLQQLLNIASKMDTRTRLCLRDGFRRLAGNAMQRRAAGDSRGSKRSSTEPYNRTCMAESSSSCEQSCSQRILTVEDIVETETNPMDRFIAHLLFHKRFPSSLAPLYTKPTPRGSISENSQAVLLHQNAWAWQEAIPSSEISPATHSSTLSGGFGASKSSHNTLDVPVSNICDKPNFTSASLSSVVSGLRLEATSNLPLSAAHSSLLHSVKREPNMIDMDTILPEVVTSSGNMDNYGEVGEPQLQVKE